MNDGPLRHLIVWTHTGDQVTAEVRCSSPPGAWCRWEQTCDCEDLGPLAQDPNGWFHFVETDDGDTIHRHRPSKECLIETWLNNDPALLIELRATEGEFRWTPKVLAETPIDPVWDGGGYSWKFTRVTAV